MSNSVDESTEVINNLDLWNSVDTTNTKYTKEATTKGGFTSINAVYQIKMATDKWGPYGELWGLQKIVKDFSLLDVTGLVLYEAEFFCPVSSFQMNNAYTVKTLKTGHVDSDFMKKVETDTITKALSRLGFNADVFMGQFDDIDYLQERQAEQEIEEAENKEKLLAERFEEIKAYAKRSCDSFALVPTVGALDKVYQKTLSDTRRKLNNYKFDPTRLDKGISKAYEEAKAALEAKKNNQ